jgi:hypothetical protein
MTKILRCPKCKKPALNWAGEILCKDWQCWDCKPANIESCKTDGALASELSAFGNDLIELIKQHQEFLSRAIEVAAPENDASAMVSALMGVTADIFWMMLSGQFVAGTPFAEGQKAYALMWNTHATHAAARASEKPAGASLN